VHRTEKRGEGVRHVASECIHPTELNVVRYITKGGFCEVPAGPHVDRELRILGGNNVLNVRFEPPSRGRREISPPGREGIYVAVASAQEFGPRDRARHVEPPCRLDRSVKVVVAKPGLGRICEFPGMTLREVRPAQLEIKIDSDPVRETPYDGV